MPGQPAAEGRTTRMEPQGAGLLGQTLRLGVGHGASKGLSFLAFLLVARFLGPTAYGNLAFLLSLGSLLAFLPGAGADPYYSREVGSGRADTPSTLRLSLGLKTRGSMLFLLLFLPIGLHLAGDQAGRRAVLPVALALVTLALAATWRTALITAKRAGLAGVVDTVPAAAFVVLALVYVRTDATVATAAYAFLAAQILALVWGYILTRRIVARPASSPVSTVRYTTVLRSTGPLMLIWFLSDLYLRLDMTLLNILRGDQETGYYAAAYRLVEGVYAGALVVCATTLPELSRAWRHGGADAWLATWRRMRWMLLGLTVPFLLAFSLAPAWLIELLFGAGFLPAAPALRVLGPATLLLCFGYGFGAALTSMGSERSQLLITGGALLVNVVLNLVLIPSRGSQGAALATMASALLYVILAQLVIRGSIRSGAPA